MNTRRSRKAPSRGAALFQPRAATRRFGATERTRGVRRAAFTLVELLLSLVLLAMAALVCASWTSAAAALHTSTEPDLMWERSASALLQTIHDDLVTDLAPDVPPAERVVIAPGLLCIRTLSLPHDNPAPALPVSRTGRRSPDSVWRVYAHAGAPGSAGRIVVSPASSWAHVRALADASAARARDPVRSSVPDEHHLPSPPRMAMSRVASLEPSIDDRGVLRVSIHRAAPSGAPRTVSRSFRVGR